MIKEILYSIVDYSEIYVNRYNCPTQIVETIILYEKLIKQCQMMSVKLLQPVAGNTLNLYQNLI
jgi:hypothetical protein